MLPKFTIQEVERTITFHEDETHDDIHEAGEIVPADLRDALDALESGCWDSLDVRGNGTIIAYPADSTQNLRTGDYESTQVIVKARRPEWADRLLDVYEARKGR